MDKEQALNAFWNGFGLLAYDENTVPSGAELPYITYELSTSDFDHPVTLSASLWYRSTSWSGITAMASKISSDIGYGGKIVTYDGGAMWIRRGTPFSQRMSDSDDSIRRIYLNIDVEYVSM